MLIPFPNSTTRTYIHIFVLANAYGKLSRVKTDALITAVLKGYGLSKLHLDGYSVYVAEPIETPSGLWPVTHIDAKYWDAAWDAQNAKLEEMLMELKGA